VRQILVNLLSNAVKFTESGEVVVAVRGQRSEVRGQRSEVREENNTLPISIESPPLYEMHIAVRDTGIGIPATSLDRLFQPFSQGDSSTTRRYGGTGLGLVICKRLVEMMNGQIWVESEEDVGSTFHVTFPARQARPKPRPYLDADQPYLWNKRVLIVESNPTNCRLLTRYAWLWGMQTVVESSGHDALMHLHQTNHQDEFDLAIVDSNLPDMAIWVLAEQLRLNCLQDMPIFLYTSLAQQNELARNTTVNVASILVKPIRPAILHRTLIDFFTKRPTSQGNIRQTCQAKPQPHPIPTTLRILIAEDNSINQQVLRHLLKKIGYQADVVATGSEVLAACHHRSYDVILMDVQMPEMDGLAATQHLRKTLPKTQQPWIIALTAHALEGDREMCLQAGMNDYLSKPVNEEELARKLWHATHKQQASNHKQSAAQRREDNLMPAQSDPLPFPSPFALDETTYQQFIATVGGIESGLAEELIDIFLKEVPNKLKLIQQAIAQKDAPAIHYTAHALKSSSLQLGALRLYHLFKELDMLTRNGKLQGTDELVGQIATEFERVQKELRQLLLKSNR
jgi:CheY-like chemotaxis protein/HPt (histidine-containing phosphotransfer) domain-containing protein